MAKPRIYLFHGNDSLASRQDLTRWSNVFVEKYGEHTRHHLYADEMSAEELTTSLVRTIESQGLFPEPTFVLVARVSSYTAARIREVTAALSHLLPILDDTLTLVIWEDQHLDARHPLRLWFEERQEKGIASIKDFKTPHDAALVKSLATQVSIDAAAERWLVQYLRVLEKEQRIEQKLHATDTIVRDRRSRQVQSLVELASLLSPDGAVITTNSLDAAVGVFSNPVSIFEIANAIRDAQWTRARTLLDAWGEDDGAYFGLYTILRNQFRRETTGSQAKRAVYALRLLAEIEVIVKNVSLEHIAIMDLFISRLALMASEGERPLLSEKRLWLSHTQRVS